MGAVITRPEIADALPIFRHVHTFSGHAGCAAAAANSDRDQGARQPDRESAPGRTAHIPGARGGAWAGTPIVGQVRGIGHWHAVDSPATRTQKAPFDDDTVAAIVRRMREKSGVLACAIGPPSRWLRH